jgi:hypothetical protein
MGEDFYQVPTFSYCVLAMTLPPLVYITQAPPYELL